MDPLKQDLSGGRIFSGWLTISEAMLCLALGMARKFFYGRMFGMISLPNSLFLAFFFCQEKDCSVQEFLDNMNLAHNLHTPLSPQAAQKYQAFHELISNLQSSRAGKDKWTYPWGNPTFSSSKLYNITFQSIHPTAAFNWILQYKVGKKFKIVVWLVFRDRINPKNILRRKGFLASDSNFYCTLCDLHCEDTTYHLLFCCPFSTECWNFVGFQWNHDLEFFSMIEASKGTFGHSFSWKTTWL
jgi:hypothetical protein